MPYDRSLQAYCLPEFFAEAPLSWEARLREISPITERLAHLRFRRFDPHPHWLHADRPVWALYDCTPKHLVSKDRALQFQLHWSELPTEFQAGRRAVVSDYQHYMWHVYGVEAQPFWILQGPNGGTPAKYTRREQRILDGCGAISEPFPLGFFPSAPFDERAVSAVVERDRLYRVGNRLDDLAKLDRPDVQKAEDEAAEVEFRKKFLDNWFAQIQPQAEFMKSRIFAERHAADLPAAPASLPKQLSTWKDQFIESGNIPGAGVASSRVVQVPVSVPVTA